MEKLRPSEEQEISNRINSLVLTTRCDAEDCSKTLEQYTSENKILLPAQNRYKIDENKFVISGSGELKFSELFSCLGLILVDQNKKMALAAHLTAPKHKEDNEKVCKNYLEQLDYIYKMDVTKVALVSSELMIHPYHKVIKKLVEERYDISDIEYCTELTVNYNIDSDTINRDVVNY